ncbi:MAG TPA: hypothetical protein VFI28_04370 [Candidatus Limnocylindrales bacterium]|nr:hypothetical protein [Candidatus Limnocylindrales bacterium]
MDERTVALPHERPIRTADGTRATAGTPLEDPRALTILTTEHWSLLSARTLVYNEAFARAGMFLTFLSATLVALGLIATQMTLGSGFLLVAGVVLGVDLFIGLATMGRVATATSEDVRYLQGMNRIRHAYHDIVPGLERYFTAGKYDDIRGVFQVYGVAEEIGRPAGVLHGFTTVMGMIGVICAAVAAALVYVLVLLVGGSGSVGGLAALAGFAGSMAVNVWVMTRALTSFATSMNPRFPTPGSAAEHETDGR